MCTRRMNRKISSTSGCSIVRRCTTIRSGRCDILRERIERVSSSFTLELIWVELESAADAREREKEIAQLMQESEDDDIDEI